MIELLAPAGNVEALRAAVNAGADAVYLAGNAFGARAFADNFSDEEILEALRLSHLFRKKIYLTVNTLMKPRELAELPAFLAPFYEAGLHGVIVQDFGAFRLLKREFPGLKLHASTQMSLMGKRGISLLKEAGASRVVPARELSLRELRDIKESVDIELEVFAHGAMCYSYSGQCLFSSFLGGRSGNRGRCAGPCRQPYEALFENKGAFFEDAGSFGGERPSSYKKGNAAYRNEAGNGKENDALLYPLSMKDLCALPLLPKLIEAGVDSLKIEGRMKSPEYTAGVTSVYRKYIDRYAADAAGRAGTEEIRKEEEARAAEGVLPIDAEDMALLRELYLRTEIMDGYYERQNGREMLTLHKPGYLGTQKRTLQKINDAYLAAPPKLPLRIEAQFRTNEAAYCRVSCQLPDESGREGKKERKKECQKTGDGKISAEAYGEIVQPAKNRPLTAEDVKKQLSKLGDTPFFPEEIVVEADGKGFLPVAAVNELRRNALQSLTDQVGQNRRRRKLWEVSSGETQDRELTRLESGKGETARILVSLSTLPQLRAYTRFAETCGEVTSGDMGGGRVFPVLSYGLYRALASSSSNTFSSNVCASSESKAASAVCDFPFLLSLPAILRDTHEAAYVRFAKILREEPMLAGVLFKNAEEAYFLEKLSESDGEIAKRRLLYLADHHLYVWNEESAAFLREALPQLRDLRFTAPLELTGWELGALVPSDERGGHEGGFYTVVYGRAPLMLSANCLFRTGGRCAGRETCSECAADTALLRDRFRTVFPVVRDCEFCYNLLLNSVPTSLHKECAKGGAPFANVRMDFTTETEEETEEILRFFFTEVFPGSKGAAQNVRKASAMPLSDMSAGENLPEGSQSPRRQADPVPPYTAYTTGHYRKPTE